MDGELESEVISDSEKPSALQTLHTVTPLSKYLAMALFVVLPFVGGWIGYTLAPVKIVEVEKVVSKAPETNTATEEAWQTYTDPENSYKISYPSDWFVTEKSGQTQFSNVAEFSEISEESLANEVYFRIQRKEKTSPELELEKWFLAEYSDISKFHEVTEVSGRDAIRWIPAEGIGSNVVYEIDLGDDFLKISYREEEKFNDIFRAMIESLELLIAAGGNGASDKSSTMTVSDLLGEWSLYLDCPNTIFTFKSDQTVELFDCGEITGDPEFEEVETRGEIGTYAVNGDEITANFPESGELIFELRKSDEGRDLVLLRSDKEFVFFKVEKNHSPSNQEWKTYKNDELDIGFSYPNDWGYQEWVFQNQVGAVSITPGIPNETNKEFPTVDIELGLITFNENNESKCSEYPPATEEVIIEGVESNFTAIVRDRITGNDEPNARYAYKHLINVCIDQKWEQDRRSISIDYVSEPEDEYLDEFWEIVKTLNF